MKSYLPSIFSLKKIKYKNISVFAIWDKKSEFTKESEIRRFTKLNNAKIGKYSRINPGCILSNVRVGNFTAIGRDSSIGLGQHPLNYISTQNIFYKKNNMTNDWVKEINFPSKAISIGNDVWVGVESLVMDGVTIGDGAVVGARSVVTKDVPPFAIVVGQPAKIIKFRFKPEIIKRLLEVKWWNLKHDEITKIKGVFNEPDVTFDLINKYFPKK